MRKFTAILVFLLMSYPVYAREGRDGTRATSAFLAAASTSKTCDTEGNEADDEKMESDTETDGMDTNGTDTDQEMKTDAHSDDDNEADDMNGETNSVKKVIRASLKTLAMKQSQSSLVQMAVAPNAGLSPMQTIKELLEPAGTNGSAPSAVGSQTSLFDSSSIVAGGSIMPASGAFLVANFSMMSGRLTSSAAPEPSAWILAATGILAPLCKRRR